MKKYLIDLDGTLYRGKEALPAAGEWIDRLNDEGRGYLLCTNCPSHSPESLTLRLSALGINTTPDHILTSGMAVRRLLPTDSTIHLMGTEEYRKWLVSAGFVISSAANTAVVGFNPSMTYRELVEACDVIQRGGAYYLTNEDHVIPDGDQVIPHTGAIGAAITCATGRLPVVLGKPHKPMMDMACGMLSCRPQDLVVFGDNLQTDILFAHRHGATSCLLLTGLTTLETLSRSTLKPDLVFRNIREVMRWEREQGA